MSLQLLVYENVNLNNNTLIKAFLSFKAISASKTEYCNILRASKHVFTDRYKI